MDRCSLAMLLLSRASCLLLYVRTIFSTEREETRNLISTLTAKCTSYQTGSMSLLFVCCQGLLIINCLCRDKRRTCTQTDTTDPVWNRSFMFENVTSKMLKLCSLEISVWSHRGHMRSRKFLGQVTHSY